MTREECEKAILAKIEEIAEIYHQYNPDGKYLDMCMNGDDGTHMSVNNAYFGEDRTAPLSAWKNSETDYYQYNQAVSA